MNLKKFSLIFALSIFSSCSEDIISLEEKAPDIKLKYSLSIQDKNTINTFNFGIWMFKEQHNHKNAIANWLNIPHSKKEILEPINILWVDFKSKTKKEASEKIASFLALNGLILRNGSSTGYSSFFKDYEWSAQFKETWSDNTNPATINNHGRIFISNNLKNDEEDNFLFVTSGAFSVETEAHLFLSFKDAVNQFNAVDNWRLYNSKLKVGNKINTSEISTFDHEGVKVFVLN